MVGVEEVSLLAARSSSWRAARSPQFAARCTLRFTSSKRALCSVGHHHPQGLLQVSARPINLSDGHSVAACSSLQPAARSPRFAAAVHHWQVRAPLGGSSPSSWSSRSARPFNLCDGHSIAACGTPRLAARGAQFAARSSQSSQPAALSSSQLTACCARLMLLVVTRSPQPAARCLRHVAAHSSQPGSRQFPDRSSQLLPARSSQRFTNSKRALCSVPDMQVLLASITQRAGRFPIHVLRVRMSTPPPPSLCLSPPSARSCMDERSQACWHHGPAACSRRAVRLWRLQVDLGSADSCAPHPEAPKRRWRGGHFLCAAACAHAFLRLWPCAAAFRRSRPLCTGAGARAFHRFWLCAAAFRRFRPKRRRPVDLFL